MKRSYEKEMMDLPGQPTALLEEDLCNLRLLNRYLGGYRTALRALRRLVAQYNLRRFSLLDVGTGSGDIPARMVRWARRRGLKADIVALETEPVTVKVVLRQTQAFPEISVVRGDAMAPPFSSSSFDFVLASQLLHHFSEEQVVHLLTTWARIARKGIIVSDLLRHPVAYHGIRALTRVATRNIMTRTDGPLSVQRAFTLAEWRELFRRAGVGQLQIFSVFPFRVAALLSLEGKHGIG